jgi:hypothetical protein
MKGQAMNAKLLYRLATVLLLLFALGHTVGFLRFKAPTEEGQAVRAAMDRVHFEVRSASLSFGGFYVGFGLFVSASFVFSAFLAWYLGGLAARDPQAIGALGWAFCAFQVANLVLSWIYFAGAPVIFASILAVCTAGAAWLAGAGR